MDGSYQWSNAKTSQISSHQVEIELEYALGFIKCRIKLGIFVTALTKIDEYRKVIIAIRINTPARFHPKSDQVLRTIGIRLHHAIYNPQIVYPELSQEDYHRILKEIRPNVWKAYAADSKE